MCLRPLAAVELFWSMNHRILLATQIFADERAVDRWNNVQSVKSQLALKVQMLREARFRKQTIALVLNIHERRRAEQFRRLRASPSELG